MKLVKVKWVDSRCRSGWRSLDELVREVNEDKMTHESVGWLVVETDKFIVLAPNRYLGKSMDVCDCMQIPKSALLKKPQVLG
jgi:hypothetical protein